jgi:polyphenol oxidase
MTFHQPDSIRYFTFDSLESAGVKHAIFTRRGGLSPPPWASLNVGGLLGDDPERVLGNRVLSFHQLDSPPESVYDVWQVHSAEVVCATAPRPPEVPHRKADAILTNRPAITLFMRFADCVPILLFDPLRRIAGIVHAGWLGTVRKTITAAVEAMHSTYASHPPDILAGIGPSIGAHHYPVGPEVATQVRAAFGQDSSALLSVQDGAVHFDLWAANRLLLEQAGLRQIEIAGICTACHPEDWYSHRGENGKTGRFGALIAL